MKKAVLFDLDGTLLDTTSGVVYAVKETITQLGLTMPSEDILKTFVGPPMQLSFQQHFGMEKEEALKSANIFRENYKNDSLFMADLYPGSLETIDFLKKNGYKISVATNKSENNAISILKHFGVADYCDSMVGSDLQGKLKKADIIEKSIAEMHLEIKDGAYVGDSIFDKEGAEKVGMDFIGADYGFGFKPGEDIGYPMIHAITDLKNIL